MVLPAAFLLAVAFTWFAPDRAEGSLQIVNRSYPVGQKVLVGLESGTLEKGLKVQVLRDGAAAAGESIVFKLTHADGKGAAIPDPRAVTDSEGMATAGITLGDKAGTYVVSASSRSDPDAEAASIVIRAYRKAWVYFLIFGMIGGLAIFLFGMEMSAAGLQRAAGDSMRVILGKLTHNPIMGALVGTLITAAVQSSSATSVMTIGFVTATLMTLPQAVGVIFGANIGTTLTVQLIAFNVSEYAPLMIGIGFLMTMAGGGKRPQLKYAGEVVLGFGFIFFGMGLMSDAMNPLRSVPAFTNLLAGLGDRAALGILVSTLFTAVIQSSGAVVGISIALASSGILTLPAAISIAFGANIGTTATALLSSLGASREGKRVALVHFIFNVVGVVLFFPFMGPFAGLIERVTLLMGSETVTRQIANAHMFFNVINTLIFLPFTKPLARLVTRIIPDRKGDVVEAFKPLYLTGGESNSPAIALEQASREIVRMQEILGAMVGNCLTPLKSRSEEALKQLDTEDDKIDSLQEALSDYLAKLSRRELSPAQSEETAYYLHVVNYLEQIGDVISKDLVGTYRKVVRSGGALSDAELKDLDALHGRMSELYGRTTSAFRDHSIQPAEEAALLYNKFKTLVKRMQDEHIKRVLSSGAADSLRAAVYPDILDALRTVTSHINLMAQTIQEYV